MIEINENLKALYAQELLDFQIKFLRKHSNQDPRISDNDIINHLLDKHKCNVLRNPRLTKQEERRFISAMKEFKNIIIEFYS